MDPQTSPPPNTLVPPFKGQNNQRPPFMKHCGWDPQTEHHSQRSTLQPHYKFPKMDFPKFDGKNARRWVSKAEKFFKLNPNIDTYTKVIYAAFYLEMEADHWYQTIQADYQVLTWELFTGLLKILN